MTEISILLRSTGAPLVPIFVQFICFLNSYLQFDKYVRC